MATLSLIGKQARAAQAQKRKPYNKKQAINAFVNKFKIPFDMKDDAIDLREMSRNAQYQPNGIIPVQDAHDAVLTVIGPTYQNVVYSYDPSFGAQVIYGTKRPKVYFDYILWNQLYIWPIFQRDVAPNHIEKIYKDFDESSVIVPCLIKLTLEKGQTIYCIWDGHHTIQVCRLMGWMKFPGWIIDVDQYTSQEITASGMFDDTDEGRIDFGCFIAGINMRRINGLNKRPLSPYDDFLIGYETRDPKFVAMMNILRKHGCLPKRHAGAAGAWTQIKSGIECFDLEYNGVVGQYWDRAIALHRATWPMASLELEIFRPFSYLYHMAAIQGLVLPSSFDTDIAQMLVNRWGSAEDSQEGIKESFWNAYNAGTLKGQIPEHDKFRVLNGLINLYKQNGGKVFLPAPTCQWVV
jgi:hypothetical protein